MKPAENDKQVTIYDIAAKLRISPSTVSRALNNAKYVNKVTKKLVKDEAEKLGYKPNSFAVGLRNNQSNTIGILISRINRPFNSVLISGVEKTARQAGYNVIICQSNDSYENEVTGAEALLSSRVVGLIASLSMETENFEHFQPFFDAKTPVVFVDRVPNLDSYKVVADDFRAGYNATQHLIKKGCKRIALLVGSLQRNVYSDRKNGYVQALLDNNLPVDESLILILKTLSTEESEKATKKLLSLPNPPDGIFSTNDTAAAAAIITAKKLGFSIPKQLKIIGFNNDYISTIVEPSLSTIAHPAEKMGIIAAEKILEHLNKNSEMDTDVSEITILKTSLIERDSTR